jgi:hypothetical protein
MANSQWKRVSKSEPCVICGKPDWCLRTVDSALAICARIESPRPTKSSAGWVHVLSEERRSKDRWRPIRRPSHSDVRIPTYLGELAERLHRATTDDAYGWLAARLGVSIDSLRSLRVGWNASKRSFSFPMMEPNARICGIRYRSLDDSKYSELGGREGLFFDPSALSRNYLIVVEGGSDTAASISLGFPSVVGRSNCVGNVKQLVTLCRRLLPNLVVIVPDNDQPGVRGAESLSAALPMKPFVLRLPETIKDVRQCISSTKNADWLRDQIGTSISSSTNGV